MKTILFDLDGTLLPMDQEIFTKKYFQLLVKKLAPLGYKADELVNAVWKGTAQMVKNNGSKTNEEVFWETFAKMMGEKVYQDKKIIDSFYENEFNELKTICGYNPDVPKLFKVLHQQGYQIILATNPIFPSVAQKARITWAGLSTNDFIYYTSYENMHASKPNLQYYQEIIDKFKLNPKECIMVGNDVGEDMIVTKLGLKVFLVCDNLINKDHIDISNYPKGSIKDLLTYITNLSI